MLELYQTTFDARWFGAAQELAETMIAHFQTSSEGFYDTSDDNETLITRPCDLHLRQCLAVRERHGHHYRAQTGGLD
jgi:uncharacterized protein YyaL (SSP411 family)